MFCKDVVEGRTVVMPFTTALKTRFCLMK